MLIAVCVIKLEHETESWRKPVKIKVSRTNMSRAMKSSSGFMLKSFLLLFPCIEY